MNNQPNRFQARAIRDYREARESEAYHQAMAGESTEFARQAALAIARAIGYCRLWGADLGELDGSVPKRLLPQIIETLADSIVSLIQGLTAFESRMETALTAEEEEMFATDILRQRMDGWACWIAVDERVQMLLEDKDKAAVDLLASQAELGAVYDQWDADLQARGDLLSTARDTYLFENWRDALAENHAAVHPWWLDDTFWDQVRAEPVPNWSPPRAASQPERQSGPVAAVESVIWTLGEPWEVAEPLVAGGATDDADALRLDFASSSDPNRSVVARVTIPARLAGDQTITVDVRFRFVSRSPQAVRVGSIVSLGAAAKGVVVCDYAEGEPPLHRATIRLTRDDVQRIDPQQGLRLSIDRHDWIPRS